MVFTFFLILPFASMFCVCPKWSVIRSTWLVHLSHAMRCVCVSFWSFDVVYPFHKCVRVLPPSPPPLSSFALFPSVYHRALLIPYPFVPFRNIFVVDAQYEMFAVAISNGHCSQIYFYLTLSTSAFRALIILCNFDFIHFVFSLLLSDGATVLLLQQNVK